MKQAESIAHIKRVGEFIPKGSMIRQSIIPVRPRSARVRLRTGCDMWRVSAKRGNLYYCENGHSFLKFNQIKLASCVIQNLCVVFSDPEDPKDSLGFFNGMLKELNSEGVK